MYDAFASGRSSSRHRRKSQNSVRLPCGALRRRRIVNNDDRGASGLRSDGPQPLLNMDITVYGAESGAFHGLFELSRRYRNALRQRRRRRTSFAVAFETAPGIHRGSEKGRHEGASTIDLTERILPEIPRPWLTIQHTTDSCTRSIWTCSLLCTIQVQTLHCITVIG